jgi:glycosyltransferase involved in cell wall biosynthesis
VVIVRRYRPALVYANGSRAAFYGGIVGKITGKPVVWHCRISQQDPVMDLLLTRLCGTVIANSRATTARFSSHRKCRVKVVYNGIDLRRFTATAPVQPAAVQPDSQLILMVARQSREKRHDLALAAFEVVAGNNATAHLVFIGAEDCTDAGWCRSIKARAAASKFSDRILWAGHVEDPRPWYRAARVFLLTSENESFGRVIVEALAAGVPVVAPRSGGIPEIIRDPKEGILVAPGSTSQTAAAIQQLLSNGKLAAEISAAGRRRAEDFSLNVHVRQMCAVFSSVLKPAPSDLRESNRELDAP